MTQKTDQKTTYPAPNTGTNLNPYSRLWALPQVLK